METKQIKEIISVFQESSLSSMELEEGNLKIKLEKPAAGTVPAAAPLVSAPLAPQEKKEEEKRETITSPLVGTFYRAKSPKDEPYVKEGQMVHRGDVICMIEAMKTMNEIQADKDGVIREILVGNGDMVEFGQDLFALGDAA